MRDDMNNYEVELSDNGGQFMPVRSVTPYNTSDGLGYSINQPVSHKENILSVSGEMPIQARSFTAKRPASNWNWKRQTYLFTQIRWLRKQ